MHMIQGGFLFREIWQPYVIKLGYVHNAQYIDCIGVLVPVRVLNGAWKGLHCCMTFSYS